MKLLNLMLITLFLISCASVEGLTGSNPIIDTLGVNLAQYNRDLADCQQYANEVEIARKAAVGAASGAAVGGVFGAILGINETAKRGAGLGAVGGGTRGVREGIRERDRVIKRCLIGRGYRVLN